MVVTVYCSCVIEVERPTPTQTPTQVAVYNRVFACPYGCVNASKTLINSPTKLLNLPSLLLNGNPSLIRSKNLPRLSTPLASHRECWGESVTLGQTVLNAESMKSSATPC